MRYNIDTHWRKLMQGPKAQPNAKEQYIEYQMFERATYGSFPFDKQQKQRDFYSLEY